MKFSLQLPTDRVENLAEFGTAEAIVESSEPRAEDDGRVKLFVRGSAKVRVVSVSVGDASTQIPALKGTIGDDSQLANIDLQNILQKQQQAIQGMSEVSKMLHDTAMAVIRKMGG